LSNFTDDLQCLVGGVPAKFIRKLKGQESHCAMD
jgi:hypothetical protein